MSFRRVVFAAFALLAILFAIGWLTRENPDERPYLRIMGGGFIFNYRVADVYYGFTAAVLRPIPTGSIIEAAFEDPAGGPPLLVRHRLGGAEMTRLSLRSPPLHGVEAGKPYHVVVRILDREERATIWSHGMDYRSQLGSEIAPEKPLTIGPGYTKNPQLSE